MKIDFLNIAPFCVFPWIKWNVHEIPDNKWERWLDLTRWFLVKAPVKLWLALTTDFSLELVASLKMSVCCAWHCGKAIKLRSFFLLQILRLTNCSSFFSSNQYDTHLFSLTPQYFLSPTLIGMNSGVVKVHTHWLGESEPDLTEWSIVHIRATLPRGVQGRSPDAFENDDLP